MFLFKAGKDTEKSRVDMIACLVAVGQDMMLAVGGSKGYWSDQKKWGGEYRTASEAIAAVKTEAPKHGWTLVNDFRTRENGATVECGESSVCIIPVNERTIRYEISCGACSVHGKANW